MEQISLDASPLTRLPGNIAIEGILNKRVAEGNPFAVYYADLDNLKAYNDHFGYIKASEGIKKPAEVIDQAVRKVADAEAFGVWNYSRYAKDIVTGKTAAPA